MIPKQGIALAILATLILFIRFFVFFIDTPKLADGQIIYFHTTLFSEPKILSKYQTFTANYGNFLSSRKIIIYAPNFPQLNYGQNIKITGPVKYKVSSQKDKVLINKNPVIAMYFPKIEAIKNEQNSLLAVIYFVRQKIQNIYQQTLPQDAAVLLLGIVFGIKGNMTADFLKNVQTTGVFHVIAASGMNVTMVSALLISMFGRFFKRQLAILFTALGIVFYAVMSGLAPSIVRASFMGIFVFSGQLFGRQYSQIYGLIFAFFVMSFIDPSVIYDIGFQLSFLSTIGIVYIKPIIPFKSPIMEDLTTTISAQIATLPILLTAFGKYSFISIIVNGLVLWTVPILMVLGALSSVLFFIPLVGKLILFLCLPFLLFFESVVNFFGKFTFTTFSFEGEPFIVIGYYLILLSIVIIRYQTITKTEN